MSPGEDGGENLLDHAGLADNHLAELLHHLLPGLGELLEVFGDLVGTHGRSTPRKKKRLASFYGKRIDDPPRATVPWDDGSDNRLGMRLEEELAMSIEGASKPAWSYWQLNPRFYRRPRRPP